MSLANTIQNEGFRAQLDVAAETFETLKDGLAFSGILDPQPAIDPRMELGSDTRELACLEVLRAAYPSTLEQENQIRQTSDDNLQVWKVIRRDDNPADPAVKLWLVKVVSGVDAP